MINGTQIASRPLFAMRQIIPPIPTPPHTPLQIGDIRLVEKSEWILSRIEGKSVLHVGPTDSPCAVERAQQGRLLHLKLQGRCKELVGLDLDQESIAQLREKFGIHDIQYGNAE